MADLFALQEKIRLGYKLTSSQEAFVIKSTDDKGRVSRRKFTGLEEFPRSAIDLEE